MAPPDPSARAAHEHQWQPYSVQERGEKVLRERCVCGQTRVPPLAGPLKELVESFKRQTPQPAPLANTVLQTTANAATVVEALAERLWKARQCEGEELLALNAAVQALRAPVVATPPASAAEREQHIKRLVEVQCAANGTGPNWLVRQPKVYDAAFAAAIAALRAPAPDLSARQVLEKIRRVVQAEIIPPDRLRDGEIGPWAASHNRLLEQILSSIDQDLAALAPPPDAPSPTKEPT